MYFKVGRGEGVPLKSVDDALLILKSILITPFVLWGVKPSGDSRCKEKVGILVSGGTDKPFGWANEAFKFRWHGFTYKCQWAEATWHGVAYSVRYEMNRMRQVREFITNGGEKGINITVEQMKAANGL